LGLLSLSGFQDPAWLFALSAPAVLLAVYLAAQGRRRQRLRQFADLAAAPSVAPARPSPWRHLPMAVLLLALLPLTIALAQPSRDVRVPRNRAVIMLVVDVSQSMMATDVPPNRLIAAQHAAQQFAEHVTPGVNLGPIPITRLRSRPSTICALTIERPPETRFSLRCKRFKPSTPC
jgi:Ca-activated chloride channel family protein